MFIKNISDNTIEIEVKILSGFKFIISLKKLKYLNKEYNLKVIKNHIFI